MHLTDGFVNYDEWGEVMKKVDEDAKLLLRVYGDILKAKPDVSFLSILFS